MKEINEQKKKRKDIINQTVFQLLLGDIVAKSQVDSEQQHLPTGTHNLLQILDFFSPALMRLHRTEQSIFTVAP